MHIGSRYTLMEFLVWTRRTIYGLFLIGIIPTTLYQVFGLKWLAFPWTVVALLGTATAFIIGFKNIQTYNRIWDGVKIWVGILGASRSWGVICRDFIFESPAKTRELVYRHFAWLTVLRFQMRETRAWENLHKSHNEEFKQFYSIPENETTLERELANYISPEEIKYIVGTKSPATQLLSLQSKLLKALCQNAEIDINRFRSIQAQLQELIKLQGQSEMMKNYPYPRQFSSINSFFISLFCLLLPFGLLKEFDKLNESIGGALKGNMVWLVIPFSVLISWVYTTLERVGESTSNPFEGMPNDVPISQISRIIEIELREMLGETELPPFLEPKNNIIL